PLPAARITAFIGNPHTLESALALTKRLRERNAAGLSIKRIARKPFHGRANQGRCNLRVSCHTHTGASKPCVAASVSAVAARKASHVSPSLTTLTRRAGSACSREGSGCI